MSDRDSLSMAYTYREARLAPFAVPWGSKGDDRTRWKHLQNRLPSPGEIDASFGHGQRNIGLISGRASDNAVCLDCDTYASYERWLTQMLILGMTPWVVRRGLDNEVEDIGGHLWLRAPVPIATKQYKKDGYEVRGQGAYALAPYSMHPTGTLYRTLLGGPHKLPELARLDDIPGLSLYEASDDPQPSRFGWRLLKGNPEALKRYATRSEAENALCLSLHNKGFDYTGAERLFEQFPGPGKFTELHQKNEQNARRYLRLTWDNAVDYAKTHTSKAERLALALVEWANDRPWPGRTGATDRTVYLAHLSIVLECKHTPYAASSRQLAERAGVGKNTAAKATRRLIEQALLSVEQDNAALFSPRYTLETPEGLDADVLCNKCTLPHMSDIESVPLLHMLCFDVFRRGGLGKTGQQVYELLAERGRLSVCELATLTGRHRTTVKRRLVTMEDVGLVSCFDSGEWVLSSGVDLGDVARVLGMAGVGVRQRERHARQRALYLVELARQRDAS